MSGFSKVHFHGSFRDYQQRVLNRADAYWHDGKIHIAAAPGSGKTVLGLELIRRLDAPCIIFSPTTAIRQQWGQRLQELFLDDPQDMEDLFSCDLHRLRLVNSVTYQALFSAMERICVSDEEDPDCSDIDLLATMKAHDIRTICLDEAHHLKNEWQKALEKFVSALGPEVRIIALTATPPYDADSLHWSRYLQLCGPVDEEIFATELVAQNHLCPHQDYVYFNYPTMQEAASFRIHRQQAALAVEALKHLPIFPSVHQTILQKENREALFSSPKEYIALLTLLRHYGLETDEKLIRKLTAKKGLPAFHLKYAEIAIQFLLDGTLLEEAQKQQIILILKQRGVYEKRTVTLQLNERLRRSLISSAGKLQSIASIAQAEADALGPRLRMLVLTDYIKKESLSKAATDLEFHSVSIVSIFETLRRKLPHMPIGVLSGGLIILPDTIDLSDTPHKKAPILNTGYSAITFSGSIHQSVALVGKLFEQGKLRILVGTKSLLGEGWDAPCVNALVLASFVGSFVLSNQMRGRALRVDKNDPGKTANIWHLVTVEPEYLMQDNLIDWITAYVQQDHEVLQSFDFEVLKRRFDAFMGPNYTTGVIESGIQRITAIQPPYHQAGIQQINEEMLRLAADRDALRRQWKTQVAGDPFAICAQMEIPREKRVPVFIFGNTLLAILLTMLLESAVAVALNAIAPATSGWDALFALLVIIPTLYLFGHNIWRLLRHYNPANSMKLLAEAVYKTLQECQLIAPSARVETVMDKRLGFVTMYLRNASVHDQNVFNTAMAELLSPIQNPRYLLIRKRLLLGFDYTLSFACPTVLGKKKEYVQVLARHLLASTGRFVPIFAHREDGRALTIKCRNRAYITQNERLINRKYKVTHWD